MRRLTLIAAIAATLTGCPHPAEPDDPSPRPDMTDDITNDMTSPDADMDPYQPPPPPPPPPVGLRVEGVTPESGARVAPDATFTVRFDRVISRERLRGAAIHGDCIGPVQLEREDTGRCAATRVSVSETQQLIITPRQPLARGASYTLRVVEPLAIADDATTLAQTFSAAYTIDDHDAPPYSRTIAMDAPAEFSEDERLGATDDKDIFLSWDAQRLYIGLAGEDLTQTNKAAYIAIGARPHSDSPGTSQLPAERWFEGSQVLLPMLASHLFFVKTVEGAPEHYARRWSGVAWGAREDASAQLTTRHDPELTTIALERSALGEDVRELDIVIYLKDLGSEGASELGWGWMFGASDPLFNQGLNTRIVSTSRRVDLSAPEPPARATTSRRFGREDTRARIYQLLVRTFSNTNATRQQNGTLAQNGSGTLDDLSAEAARAIASMGMTHVWLTGVLQQATSTDWSSVGQPPDDPDILKGRAGSPYAIRDYFDVSPDYARDPAKRLDAFQAAVDRMHDAGLKVIIDLVPNHVARSYQSDVRPELSFGEGDDRGAFFSRDNHFFYLQSGDPPLTLPGFDRGAARPLSPTCEVLRGGDPGYQCDGLFDWRGMGETSYGRVTGNNVISFSPALNSWYETVKLNYGLDFTTGALEHPHDGQPELPIPRTWLVMDAVIAHWQRLGVDGFRADMVHMVPMAFHGWLIARSRARNPDVLWLAEAYDTDPAKVTQGNVLHALLGAGFDAVYDDDTYDALKAVFDGDGWLNDLDQSAGVDPILTHHTVRYAENHDEVRLASPHDWRFEGRNVGRDLGPAIATLLHGLGRGPAMYYAGQETGEPAEGVEGFGGDDGRTSIFDYWSMPTFTGWVNGLAYDGGGLDADTRALRARHVSAWRGLEEPLFSQGKLWPLNSANLEHAPFGRVGDETVSGHYGYAYLRHDAGRAVLVYVWLHPTQTARDVSVLVPREAWQAAGLDPERAPLRTLTELALAQEATTPDEASDAGIALGDVAPGQWRIIAIE